MNWRDYEIYIARHFARIFPDAAISHDVHLPGLFSKIDRQIDVLITTEVAGFTLSIAIDCKCFSSRVGVNDVDQFLSLLRDIRISKGVMITNVGYTEAAYARAMNDSRDVELRIIEFTDLRQFEGFIAIPYFGPHGLVLSAPEGWVIDIKPPRPQLAAMHPLGLTSPEAFHTAGYMYVAHSIKTSLSPTLEHLLDSQMDRIESHYASPKYSVEPVNLRDDCRTVVRHLEAKEVPGTSESTLFLDFPEVIVFLCLLSPAAKHADYVRKLYWVGEKLIKLHILYDSKLQPLRTWTDESGAQ